MQRAVPRNPPPSPGDSPQLGHVDAAVTCLWVLTPLAATVSIVIVIVAILTNQWLHTDEKMNNPVYNGTGEKDYLSKLTVSGLWTLCYTNHVKYALTCENNKIDLKCDKNKIIDILEANYGRTTEVTCMQGSVSNVTCYNDNTLAVVSDECTNKRSCKVQASNNIFGDPCHGTFKYLSVKYKCVDAGELHYDCNNIEYFSKEEYSPDPNDSTMAIPYAVTRSMVFFLVATMLLCCGYCCCLLGHCARHRRLCTFVSGVFFIVSGLIMLFGLVMYISVFKAEIGSKLRPRSQLQGPRFNYRYGFSFLMYVSGFVTTELAGISAIFLFIYRQQRDWHRKAIEDMRRGKVRGGHHSHGHPSTVNYLHVADHMMHHHHTAGLFYPPCRRHPTNAYINSNSSAIQLPLRYPSPPAHQKRYYFNKEPLNESPCSIHRNRNPSRSSNSLKDVSAYYDFPPPPTISYQFDGVGIDRCDLSSEREHRDFPRDVTTNTVSTTADVNCEEFPPEPFDDYSPSIQHEHEFVTFDLDAPLPLRAQSSVSINSRSGRKDAGSTSGNVDTLRRTTPV